MYIRVGTHNYIQSCVYMRICSKQFLSKFSAIKFQLWFIITSTYLVNLKQIATHSCLLWSMELAESMIPQSSTFISCDLHFHMECVYVCVCVYSPSNCKTYVRRVCARLHPTPTQHDLLLQFPPPWMYALLQSLNWLHLNVYVVRVLSLARIAEAWGDYYWCISGILRSPH